MRVKWCTPYEFMKLAMPDDALLPLIKIDREELRKLFPLSERTCSTCSKTCDVGQKCWWCGNE